MQADNSVVRLGMALRRLGLQRAPGLLLRAHLCARGERHDADGSELRLYRR